MTSHIECKVDRVQIDRFETLYPNIASKLLSRDILDGRATSVEGLAVDPMRFVLEKWTKRQLRNAGVKETAITKPFDAEDRLHRQFHEGLFQSNLSPDFTRALAAFGRATLTGDVDTTSSVCLWLRGVVETMRIPSHYLQKPSLSRSATGVTTDIRPIGTGTAHDAMRGLLWLIRSSGYSGLILCIDEVEELSKLGSRKRQDQALQALREYVDHAGGEGGYLSLCMYWRRPQRCSRARTTSHATTRSQPASSLSVRNSIGEPPSRPGPNS